MLLYTCRNCDCTSSARLLLAASMGGASADLCSLSLTLTLAFSQPDSPVPSPRLAVDPLPPPGFEETQNICVYRNELITELK